MKQLKEYIVERGLFTKSNYKNNKNILSLLPDTKGYTVVYEDESGKPHIGVLTAPSKFAAVLAGTGAYGGEAMTFLEGEIWSDIVDTLNKFNLTDLKKAVKECEEDGWGSFTSAIIDNNTGELIYGYLDDEILSMIDKCKDSNIVRADFPLRFWNNLKIKVF